MNWWVKTTIKLCTTIDYIEHVLILASAVTECTSGSAFVSLIGISIEITSSARGLNIGAITSAIKKYKSIIKKMKKKHYKIVLLAKYKLNSIKILISKALIYSNISDDECVLINNVIKKYEE